jgi:hypothetical protein
MPVFIRGRRDRYCLAPALSGNLQVLQAKALVFRLAGGLPGFLAEIVQKWIAKCLPFCLSNGLRAPKRIHQQVQWLFGRKINDWPRGVETEVGSRFHFVLHREKPW